MTQQPNPEPRITRIRFSQHAVLKFEILRYHGVDLTRDAVIDVLRRPTAVFQGYAGRRIAQSSMDATRVLRVIYEETEGEVVIVTFYPGKKSRYEQDPI